MDSSWLPTLVGRYVGGRDGAKVILTFVQMSRLPSLYINTVTQCHGIQHGHSILALGLLAGIFRRKILGYFGEFTPFVIISSLDRYQRSSCGP